MRRLRRIVIALIALAALFGTGALGSRSGGLAEMMADALSAVVGGGAGAGGPPRAIDGDTFEIEQDKGSVTVRVALIDAGESTGLRYGQPTCGGPQGTRFARRWARDRHEVKVQRVPGLPRSDRYDRRLGRLVDARGADYGLAAVRRGWARVVVYEEPRGSGAAYLLRLRGAQAKARIEGRGGWTTCRW